jgi:polysaccharide deacetylase family protein (PEP-CTERM system associated)
LLQFNPSNPQPNQLFTPSNPSTPLTQVTQVTQETQATRMITNALTIDVEDYFQVQAFAGNIRHEDWGNYESRVEGNTRRILDLLTDASSLVSSDPSNPKNPINLEHRTLNPEPASGVKATFFILGWIAERYPKLIKEIHSKGHEIACHGYAHRLIYEQSPEEFREDIRKAKAILEDITGGPVIGYRAPSYSITGDSLWAFEVLMEEGFQYDSSIFPIRHDFYGMPDAPRFPFLVSLNGNGSSVFKPVDSSLLNGTTHNPSNPSNPSNPTTPINPVNPPRSLIEFPISTVRLGNLNLPLSGGGYFRLLPYPIIQKGLKRINQNENRPFIFYLHPWELDPDQPRVAGAGAKSRFRHYLNLDKTETRFKRLLKEFSFSSIIGVLGLEGS